MTIKDITDAFLTALATAAGTLPVKWPGLAFDPPASGKWLEVSGISIDPEEYATGEGTVERGIFRVLVCSHKPASVVGLLQTAETVAAAFAKGTTFGCARIDQTPGVGQMVESPDAGKVLVPVSIRWRATR